MPSRKLEAKWCEGTNNRVIKMTFVECSQRCQAHRNNISRYERLLKTYLTDIERNFIELRLSEEQVALRQINQPTPLGRLRPGNASPTSETRP